MYNEGSLKQCKVTDLKAFLKSVGEKQDGKKDELIEKVSAYFGKLN